MAISKISSEQWMFHVDVNFCYAQIAIMENKQLRGKPVAVCGDPKKRGGITLAATPEAKYFGVKTGDVIFEALKKCPKLTIVGVDRKAIRRYTNDMVRICSDYTDRMSRMGDDELYMDISHTLHLFGGDPLKLAESLQFRILQEIGLMVSIGISFCKVFAKLGSDMRKPYGITMISKENYREIVWPLSVSDLYYVGRKTAPKMASMGILTIGQLAKCDVERLEKRFGKNGVMLWRYANGLCDEVIPLIGDVDEEQSIGHSKTAIRDLRTEEDIKILTTVLVESVAERLRDSGFKSLLVSISLRSAETLGSITRQRRLPFATCTAKMLGKYAYELMLDHWDGKPLRGIGVRACNLVEDVYQLCLLPEVMADQKQETLERVRQDIRRRFGHFSISTGTVLLDTKLANIDIRDRHSQHATAFQRKIQ